ncbi:NAD(P)/FAD-dependent oxidoreductase [Streptomyces varsoviensis]|uniref:NAD(P)/FAD-dependent oxidoreductase n=1 Tax=Streptomyces varsoviensis TaxID=67373 RepID=UPI0006621FBC|nr:FAD-dependent monooxygenase [Streptomyces varsoviensis]
MNEPIRRPDATAPAAPHPRAVVLGTGLAGLLTAAVLAEHGASTTLVDRDRLPRTPAARKGLPQARHAHLLWSGGARVIESLLPGTTDRWLAAGARRIPLPTGLVALTAKGWLPRWPEMQYLVACTRDLLDWGVREQVLAHPRVTLRDGADVLGLDGDARRVTGVRLRDPAAADGAAHLPADLVVDATGRGSHAPRWLAELGLPAVREERVDSGLAYSTRIFRAPPGAENFPVVSVQPRAGLDRPAQGATLVPIEDGRWLITASGTRGGEPPADADGFEEFCRRLDHPVLADLIAQVEPVTDVFVSHSTVNRRRRFERLPLWPAGFVAAGDSLATFNPVYGQGMSVAALGAEALRAELRRGGLGEPGLARRAQRALARTADNAWDLATGQDIRYPGAIGDQPPVAARLLRGYFDRLTLAATGRPAVARAMIDVMTLSAPLDALLRPAVALAVLRGPATAPLPGPPFTAAERDLCRAPR